MDQRQIEKHFSVYVNGPTITMLVKYVLIMSYSVVVSYEKTICLQHSKSAL